MKKKLVHLFIRKTDKKKNFSIENFYFELFKNNHHEKYIFKFKYCPFESRGVLRRLYLIIWAYFNQGDINHILGDINFISIFLNKKKTINTILDIYSLIRLKGFKKKIYEIFWINIPLHKSIKIITISSKIKKDLSHYGKFNNNFIDVIDVCINKNFNNNKKKHNKIPNILIIGTAQNKNLINQIKSLENLKCKLFIIGILSERYLNLLKDLKINYINYIGITNNKIINIYKNIDLLLYASTYEGFGIPILEAQKSGVPVITSNLDPMKFVAGRGAKFVNPRSVKSIREAIRDIIENKKTRNRLIEFGHINEKRFDKNKIIQKYYNCYEEILS